MAGNLSNTAEEKILLSSVGKAASSWPPTGVWCALFTAAPSDTAFGTEVSGTGYARVQVTSSTTISVFGTYDSTTGSIKNNGTYNASTTLSSGGSGIITFATAQASWGTVTHVALLDSSTGTAASNVIWYGQLTTPKTVNNGDTVSFAASDLVLSLD